MMTRVHAETTHKLLAVLEKDHLPKPGKMPNPDPNQAKQLTDLVNAPRGHSTRPTSTARWSPTSRPWP